MSRNWKGFYSLLDQYQKGTINPIKKQVIDFWYNALGDHELEQQDEITSLGSDDQNRKKRIWENIRQNTNRQHESETQVIHRKWWQSVYFRLAAACVVLLVGFASYRQIFGTKTIIASVPDSAFQGMLVQTNHGDSDSLINLPDGSTVALMQGATIYYPKVFAGNERKVYLKGNGMFDVTPDKTKPFLVYSDHICTRVVGTSFSIRQKEKGSIEVAVLTGIVKVQKNEEELRIAAPSNEVILTPNKKVTFYPETKELITGLVEQPVIIETRINAFDNAVFDLKDAAVADIVILLEKAYGVDIELANADLAVCSITADVTHPTSLFEKLEILTEAIGAQFVVVQDKIMITGNGCKGIK